MRSPWNMLTNKFYNTCVLLRTFPQCTLQLLPFPCINWLEMKPALRNLFLDFNTFLCFDHGDGLVFDILSPFWSQIERKESNYFG